MGSRLVPKSNLTWGVIWGWGVQRWRERWLRLAGPGGRTAGLAREATCNAGHCTLLRLARARGPSRPQADRVADGGIGEGGHARRRRPCFDSPGSGGRHGLRPTGHLPLGWRRRPSGDLAPVRNSIGDTGAATTARSDGPRLGFQSERPAPPIWVEEEADQRSIRQQAVAGHGRGGGGGVVWHRVKTLN